MNFCLLTAYQGSILGPIARLMGFIMDKIYVFLTQVLGIYNGSIAITIMIFTVFIYICLFPLTYRQQRFSILTKKMQPEINAIRKKYANKKDQASQMAMNEETQQIYEKYGVSPTGSCVQMLIQMPILFALYRLFANVPAYITSVKGVFSELVEGIVATPHYASLMKKIYEDANIRSLSVKITSKQTTADKDYIIDVLYKLNDDGWDAVAKSFPSLHTQIDSVKETLHQINYLFVLNISDTPWRIMMSGFDTKNIALFVTALLIPVCAYASQMLNLKLIQQTNDPNDQMAQQMKTMNMMMPLMSLFFTFVTPVGLGLYWIVGALVRTVQQIFLNKHFEKIDLDQIIEQNKEKAAKKREKRGIKQEEIKRAATMNTRKDLSSKAQISDVKNQRLDEAAKLRENAKSTSMAAKANLVKDFNEGNL